MRWTVALWTLLSLGRLLYGVDSPSAFPTTTSVEKCEKENQFINGQTNELFCYTFPRIPCDKAAGSEQIFALCRQSLTIEGYEPIRMVALTLNSEEEAAFIVRRFLKNTGGRDSVILLGVEDGKFLDGSDTSFINSKSHFKLESFNSTDLALFDTKNSGFFKLPKNLVRGYGCSQYNVAICKARVPLKEETKQTAAPLRFPKKQLPTTKAHVPPEELTKLTTDGEPFDLQRQFTGLWKPRRSGARSAMLSAVVAVTVALLIVDVDVF